jgi:hypothetical protein
MSKTYNDVAQGKDNKTVRKADADKTLADINANIGLATVESDDLSPGERLKMNTPDWQNGAYEPGADNDAAETFVEAFNEPDELPGMDEPTPEQLAEIEHAA